jgi:hypothetical protein
MWHWPQPQLRVQWWLKALELLPLLELLLQQLLSSLVGLTLMLPRLLLLLQVGWFRLLEAVLPQQPLGPQELLQQRQPQTRHLQLPALLVMPHI